jgi:hypothetical protein
MAGLTLESVHLAAIAVVLVALLSLEFASRPASAIPLLLLVEMDAAASFEPVVTVLVRAVGFCEPRLLRRPGGSAVHRGSGAAARVLVGCRCCHLGRPASASLSEIWSHY